MDIVSKILAFSGPQIALALSRTCHFWHDVMDDESTWRTMCEELYKWKEGDETPTSWKLFYQRCPCVPVDYRTIPSALSRHQTSDSCRIWLRPGKYVLRESIVVESATKVSMETMEVPSSWPATPEEEFVVEEETPSPSAAKRAAASIRNMLSCRSVSVVVNEMEPLEDSLLEEEELVVPQSTQLPPLAASNPPARACLVLRTRRQNEPVIRVRQGTIQLVNMAVVHNSSGIDIWNGNAAIQIQPPLGSDERPVPTIPRPTAILERVDVTSRSGRGIVNIDGGSVTIQRAYVHDCAATGIYVGGPGSDASIELTDVVRNGGGNKNRRGGIARGHSGIYLEQGNARVVDCNISRNSLTGISAVSVSNAVLTLEACDLVANGSVQLEMPPNGSMARRRSLTRNNHVSVRGMARTRSGLVEEE